MLRKFGGAMAIASACLLTAVPATAAEPEFNLTKKVWVDGRTVKVFAQMPTKAGGVGPDEPSPGLDDVEVYLVGYVHENAPYGPEMTMPADPITGKTPGPVVPAHDDTFAAFADKPVDTFGYWIVAGPKATPETVKTQPMPAHSIAEAPLVQQLKLDGKWQPLTHVETVRRGLEEGLIAKKFATWGGVAWLKDEPSK